MTRRLTPITAVLALALLCLPTFALARSKSRNIKAVPAKVHHSRLVLAHGGPRPRLQRPSRSPDRSPGHHFRKHEADPQPIRRTRNRRHVTLAAPLKIASPTFRKKISNDPLLVVSRPAPEAHETGISRPPDLSDTFTNSNVGASAANAAPVVSIIRSTPDRPQLPPINEVASTPEILPSLYNKRGRLIMPPPMKGSHEILLHQNEVADRDGLERVQDDDDLEGMRRRSILVALPINAGLQVDERLPFNRRYCRPWTAQFLTTLARAHYAHFHTPLQVNSAVRTVAFQQRLIRTNGNAAPAEGETASPHLTGQAVDLAKRGLSLSEIAWMRGYLLPLVQEGKIDVEEEFQQSCFHVSVYKRYLPAMSTPRRSIAVTHRDSPAALAIAIP